MRAVAQLACQQPDASVVFRALEKEKARKLLRWMNKPQVLDPCIETLSHSGREVSSLAVSEALLVCGAGKTLVVYRPRTYEKLLEYEGKAELKAVAICDKWIAVGFGDGTLVVWEAGETIASPKPHTSTAFVHFPGVEGSRG